MDTEFQVNEKSIRDIVRAEMQRVSAPWIKKEKGSNAKAQKQDKQVNFSKHAGEKTAKKSQQQRRSRSANRKATVNSRGRSPSSSNTKKKPHLASSSAGRQGVPAKNGKRRGSGHGT